MLIVLGEPLPSPQYEEKGRDTKETRRNYGGFKCD